MGADAKFNLSQACTQSSNCEVTELLYIKKWFIREVSSIHRLVCVGVARVVVVAGAYPSCLGMRGRVQPWQVAIPSQGHI